MKKKIFWMVIRRSLLIFFTMIGLLVLSLCVIMFVVFKGPSPTARDVLTMSLTEASATKWIPGLYLGDELVAQIRSAVAAELPDDVTDTSKVVIAKDNVIAGGLPGRDPHREYFGGYLQRIPHGDQGSFAGLHGDLLQDFFQVCAGRAHQPPDGEGRCNGCH